MALDVQERWIVLQEKRCAVGQVYCNRGSWLLKKLYCNTVYCIVTGCWADGHYIAIHSGVL